MDILIVGAGALGSLVVPLLRNHATMSVMDFDRVESKNTLSQFYGVQSIGKNKAQELSRAMKFMYKTSVIGIPHKLNKDNVEQIFYGYKLIVDCVDNSETRNLIHMNSMEMNIPCLHAGLATDGAFGTVLWDKDFHVESETEGAVTCEDGDHLPFISLVSSYLARSVQTFIKNGKKLGYEITPVNAMPV